MMSPKTSCKGARNPCREMTHENSGWAGHPATAGAEEESDVAGYSAAAIVDERRVASSTIELPCYEAVESHASTQVPYVPLCRACIVGRGREAPQPFHLDGAVLVTKNLFSFKNISSITPRAYTPKAHAVQTFQRCGVGKDFQRMLVDHNYQIEQGEIQQRSNSTTYTVFTTNRDQVIERTPLPINVSSS